MGGNSSTAKTDIVALSGKEFAYAHEISDPHFGDGLLFRNEDSEEMVIKVPRLDNDEEQYNQRIEDAEIWSQIQHHYLVNLLKYESDSKREVCSTFFQLMLYYEYLPHNLAKEIAYRKANGFAFDEKEIFYVAKVVLSALDFLQAKSQLHEDIRPFNLIISDQGQAKLLCNKILKAGMTQAMLIRAHNMKEECYLSPLLIESLVTQNQAFSIPFKSDAFSVGLILLEMATFRRTFKLYEWEKGQINKLKLEKRLSLMSQRYSNNLVEITRKLLEMEERNRPDPGQLLSLIPASKVAPSLKIAKEALQLSKLEAVAMHNNSNYSPKFTGTDNKSQTSKISLRSTKGRLNSNQQEPIPQIPISNQNIFQNSSPKKPAQNNEFVLITEYSQKKAPELNEFHYLKAANVSEFKENPAYSESKNQNQKVFYNEKGEMVFDFVYTASDYNAPFKALNTTHTTAIDSTHRTYYLIEKYRNTYAGNITASVAQTNPASLKYSVAQPAYKVIGDENANQKFVQMYSQPQNVQYLPIPTQSFQTQREYTAANKQYMNFSPNRQKLGQIHPNVHLAEADKAIHYMQMKESQTNYQVVSNQKNDRNFAKEDRRIQILHEARNDHIDILINSVKEEQRRQTMNSGDIELYRNNLRH